MNPDVTNIDALESAQATARRVVKHHLAGLPVIGRDGRLLAAITADAAVAPIAPTAWRDQSPRVFP